MKLLFFILYGYLGIGCNHSQEKANKTEMVLPSTQLPTETETKISNNFYIELAQMALLLTKDEVVYDPSYHKITYPNGDVPIGKGVCSDVVIRAYRKMGIDLQKEVHEDMKKNFAKYPKSWGLKTTDTNIDHRRVPNLMRYFERQGADLEISLYSQDYKPGEIVAWNLGGAVTHIGVVSAVKSEDGKRFKMVHNIGSGQVLEDCLFNYKIIGHYRFGERNK